MILKLNTAIYLIFKYNFTIVTMMYFKREISINTSAHHYDKKASLQKVPNSIIIYCDLTLINMIGKIE